MIDLSPPDHKARAPEGWPSDLPYPADRHAVRAAIYRRGSTLRAISRAAGIAASSAGVALHCRKTTAGELAIADFLGVAREALFDQEFWSRSRAVPQPVPRLRGDGPWEAHPEAQPEPCSPLTRG